MRTIKMEPGMLNVIGRAGENLAVQARFRVTEDFSSLYGAGTFELLLQRPDEAEAYAVQTQVDGADLIWNVSATDTEKQGYAQAELRYYAGDTLAKSMRYRCFIEPSVGQPSEEPPEPWQSWVDEVLEAGVAAKEAKEEWENMTAEAETLPAGSPATASYAEGVLTLGIPQGTQLPLRRMGSYLFELAFTQIPPDSGNDWTIPGACSSYVQTGRLYRNLDWDYDELASFKVICPGFTGMAFMAGLTDAQQDVGRLLQLPYNICDGVNDSGIMCSLHVLYNDWGWHGTGSIPLTRLPYLVLTTVHSMATMEAELAEILPQLHSTPAMDATGYLVQCLVTDGTTTKAILPPTTSGGNYSVVNISANPKLTNFRWVADAIVNRADLQERPTGVERWNMIPASLEALRFTAAYEAPTRLSEFIGLRGTTKDSTDAELTEIYDDARAAYLDRERDGQTWQTMHSVVYSPSGMEHLWVQENWNRDHVASGGGASSWLDLTGKPFVTIGDNLKVVGGALTVDTAPNVQQDNTKPITSAAVYTEVGNIHALLALI